MKAPKREDVRAAWDEIRALALGCIEGSPYGNEAASLILDTMDSMVPQWAEAAPTTPETTPKPAPVSAPKPEPPPPAPSPIVFHWDMEWRYDARGIPQCRGTLTHLATGVSDTSDWWRDSGDAHAEAEQGLRNKLALRHNKQGQGAPRGESWVINN